MYQNGQQTLKQPYQTAGSNDCGPAMNHLVNCAQQSAAYEKPPATPELEQIERGLQSHLDHLHTLTLRLQNVADRVFGGQPQPEGKATAMPTPESSLARIHQLGDWISQRTSALADEIARVERL